MLLSEALEGRREGIWRRALVGGGMETLARSTTAPPISGSLDLALRAPAGMSLAAESCCHDCVFSALTVRDSESSMAEAKYARQNSGVIIAFQEAARMT